MKIFRLARACSWPTNSESCCGRSEVSPSSSVALRRDDAGRGGHLLRQFLQAQADELCRLRPLTRRA